MIGLSAEGTVLLALGMVYLDIKPCSQGRMFPEPVHPVSIRDASLLSVGPDFVSKLVFVKVISLDKTDGTRPHLGPVVRIIDGQNMTSLQKDRTLCTFGKKGKLNSPVPTLLPIWM
jgi:hypothetical protein